MKTLYLHIGLPKTGTSAIQSFLMANPEVLEKQGYCYKPVPFSYPKISKNRNCHFLVDNSYDEEGNYDAAQTRAKQEEGMQFVLNWFETYDSVILSDEALWVSSTRKAENPLDLVVEYSKKYNFALKVIVYIRRQDDLISSW